MVTILFCLGAVRFFPWETIHIYLAAFSSEEKYFGISDKSSRISASWWFLHFRLQCLVLMLATTALSSGSEVTRLTGLRGGTNFHTRMSHRWMNCGERQSENSMSQSWLCQTPMVKRKMLASSKFPSVLSRYHYNLSFLLLPPSTLRSNSIHWPAYSADWDLKLHLFHKFLTQSFSWQVNGVWEHVLSSVIFNNSHSQEWRKPFTWTESSSGN